MTNAYLLNLLHLTDPTLPIGGFSHSAGLETYVQQGIVCDKNSANDFIVNMLLFNLRFTDAALVSLAYDAALNEDLNAILHLDETCSAVKLAKEIRQASEKLGIRLLKIFSGLTDQRLLRNYQSAISNGDASGHFCIAFGIMGALLEIPKRETIQGFYYNAAAGMVTNSVKLIPLGQQDGQRILFGLHALIQQLSKLTLNPDVDLIGLCCPAFDMRSMQHERLYSRLYMS